MMKIYFLQFPYMGYPILLNGLQCSYNPLSSTQTFETMLNWNGFSILKKLEIRLKYKREDSLKIMYIFFLYLYFFHWFFWYFIFENWKKSWFWCILCRFFWRKFIFLLLPFMHVILFSECSYNPLSCTPTFNQCTF